MNNLDRLKFRIFVKTEKRLITNVTGFVIDINKEKIRIFRMNDKMADGMSSELFMLKDVIIDQCTGWKDSEDNLIYEGDRVDTPMFANCAVGYSPYGMTFTIRVCSDPNQGEFDIGDKLWWNPETESLELNSPSPTVDVDLWRFHHAQLKIVGNIHTTQESSESK